MKGLLITVLCLCVLSGFSQKKKEDSPKTITVVLTEEQMVSAFYLLQTGKTYIFDSEMPAKQAKEAYRFGDSLSKVFTDQAALWHPTPAPTEQPKKNDSTSKK